MHKMRNFKAALEIATIVLLVAAFLMVAVLTLTDRGRTSAAFTGTSYVIIKILLLVWAVMLFRALQTMNFSLVQFLRSSRAGLIAALFVTTFVALTAEDTFKFLADETNQVSTARSFYRERQINVPVQGAYVEGGSFKAIERQLPKRPLLYPYLGHILHRVFGESERNLFRLNLAILYAFLFLVFSVGSSLAGFPAGLAAMLLFLSNPIVTLVSRSAGFDLLSAFMLFASLAILWAYLRNPSVSLFGLLTAQLILLSHVRYENFIYLFVIFAALILLRLVGREQLRGVSILLAAGPLFLLPLIWQFALSRGQYENPDGVPLFSLDHFLRNGKQFLGTQLDFNFAFQSSLSDFTFPLFLLSGAVLIFAAWRGKLPVRHSRQGRFAVIVLLVMAVNLTVFLSLVHSDLYIRGRERFYMSSFILFSQAPLALLLFSGAEVRRWLLLALGAALFSLYYPIAANRYAHFLHHPDTEFQLEFLADYDKEKTLAINPHPDQLTALGYGAVLPGTFNVNRRWFLQKMKAGVWNDVFVFQEFDTTAGRVKSESRIFPVVKLDKIAVVHMDRETYLKVSRAIPR